MVTEQASKVGPTNRNGGTVMPKLGVGHVVGIAPPHARAKGRSDQPFAGDGTSGGPDRPWYRHALSTRSGRIRAEGLEADVEFGDADPAVHDVIDADYHTKYDRCGPGPISHVTGTDAHSVTIRLVRQAHAA